MLIDKIFIITGGTGYFGNAILWNLIFKRIIKMHIFSFDKNKRRYVS
jgi:FlaA1/EpsC-like NDP-sugar epimerase